MDQHSKAQSETLQATSVLEFRVSRPGIPIRRLRLTGNRYTFGRDRAATVRLDDPALQPVHAVLRREAKGDSERLVLQSMTVPLQVNDRLTTETTLHTGDHFQLGAFRFEFIGSVDVPRPASSVAPKIKQFSPGSDGAPSAEDSATFRKDGTAKALAPRLSFAAGMRLVDESESSADTEFPMQPERTLDAIEQALSAETGTAGLAQDGTALRQQIEQTLRKESQRALDRQKMDLSQQHRREMEKVLQRFAETQEQAASANRAIETMRQQVADLGTQLRNATEIKWEHQEAFERAGKERDEAQEEMRQVAAKSQQLISELDAARRDRSEISSSLHDVTIQLYTATAEGDKAQRRARELTRQREEAIQKVESFARRCEELTEQLREAELTCQTVSDQRDRFAEELRQRTEERDSAIALADQRSDELLAKESVIDKLRSQVTELEEAVAESRREAETLRTECQAACDSVAKLEETVRQGEQQRLTDRASWEAESAELRASVEQISIELAAASSELTRSNETTDALNAELDKTRAALTEAESEVAIRPSADELQAIRERLETTEQQLRDLQSETEVFASAAESYEEDPAEAEQEPSLEPASTPSPWAIDSSLPWNQNDESFQDNAYPHEMFSHEYDHDGESQPAADSYENESVMQEGEIEQIREFLRSEDPAAELEPSGEDEAFRQEERDHPEPEASGPPATGTAESDVDDDDSIEAYMNRLLQRVQGGSSGAYSPGQPTSANATDQVRSNPRETIKQDAPEPAQLEAPIDADEPFVPRSQAPERSKNLAAMRELANSSARTAIMSSVRKQAYSTAIRKFAQAAGCAAGATVMLYFSQLKFGWQMLAAICMTLLAAYWVVEALQLQARLRMDGERVSTATDPTAGIPPEDEAPPQETDAAEPEQ